MNLNCLCVAESHIDILSKEISIAKFIQLAHECVIISLIRGLCLIYMGLTFLGVQLNSISLYYIAGDIIACLQNIC